MRRGLMQRTKKRRTPHQVNTRRRLVLADPDGAFQGMARTQIEELLTLGIRPFLHQGSGELSTAIIMWLARLASSLGFHERAHEWHGELFSLAASLPPAYIAEITQRYQEHPAMMALLPTSKFKEQLTLSREDWLRAAHALLDDGNLTHALLLYKEISEDAGIQEVRRRAVACGDIATAEQAELILPPSLTRTELCTIAEYWLAHPEEVDNLGNAVDLVEWHHLRPLYGRVFAAILHDDSNAWDYREITTWATRARKPVPISALVMQYDIRCSKHTEQCTFPITLSDIREAYVIARVLAKRSPVWRRRLPEIRQWAREELLARGEFLSLAPREQTVERAATILIERTWQDAREPDAQCAACIHCLADAISDTIDAPVWGAETNPHGGVVAGNRETGSDGAPAIDPAPAPPPAEAASAAPPSESA